MNDNKPLTLDAAVSLLTRNTPQSVKTEDAEGSPVTTFKMWPSLLGQLRAAFQPSMGAGSGGGSGRPAPLALNAFDLMRRIESVSTHQYWTLGGTSRLDATSLEKRIWFWATKALATPAAEKEATQMITGWCMDIEALFNPEHRIELRGKCPECGWAYYLVEEEGEIIRKRTLTAVPHERGTFASCGYCKASWSGYRLHDLADHVTRVS
ncbi:hypothetical protein [Arthrobacter sp. UYCu712]|uniref:DUF7341 domain-containing protein n=1 Tax=Arthrobacter sp. UYCu712 TaxID=3156340 RepID=UPI003399B3E2